MNKLFFLLIFYFFMCVQAFGHQDKIIEVDKNGNMHGLPKKYLPAKIELAKRKITIAGRKFRMPPCIFKYFEFPDRYKLFVTSSWYHHNPILPPYINFIIEPHHKNWEFRLLFSLEDIQPISFHIHTDPEEAISHRHKIEISNRCKKEIKKFNSSS